VLRTVPTLAFGLAAVLLLAPAAAPAQQTDDERRDHLRGLLDLRAQLHGQIRALNTLIEGMGDVPPLPRERPSLPDCPWPMPMEAVVLGEPALLGEAAVPAERAEGRRRIPDCYPPGWMAPTPEELARYDPPSLLEDRPRPIVHDYLGYTIQPPPPELVERFNLDTTFYRKHADANGYPILASAKVPEAALAIVRDQVNYMLGHRPDIRDEMIRRGARLVIMAETEYTTDIPEQRDWIVPPYLDPRLTSGERENYYESGGLAYRSGAAYWNARARGMGGTLTSCAEENVLGYYGTRYWGTNICVHEFAHAIMGAGIGNADPGWFQEIVDAYHAAREQGLVTVRGYAGNTFNEYWAVNLEWYVGNGGRDRAALKEIDPRIYELISRLIPEGHVLPARANVAHRPAAEMSEYVRAKNPDWWVREQEREREREAARAGRGAGGGGGGGGGGVSAPVPRTAD
jgi:hypothetical protein